MFSCCTQPKKRFSKNNSKASSEGIYSKYFPNLLQFHSLPLLIPNIQFLYFFLENVTSATSVKVPIVETIYMEETKTKLQKLDSIDSTKSYFSVTSRKSSSNEQDFYSVCSQSSAASS